MSKQDPGTFKYGQPLFAAAWPRGQFIFVCGGGGSANTGIRSRVVAATYQDGRLSDEVGSVTLKTTCDRLSFCPTSRTMLVLSGGRVVPYEVGISDNQCQFLVPQEQVVQAYDRLAGTHVKALVFSGDGTLLVFGTAQGVLHIWRRDGLLELAVQQLKVDQNPVQKEITNVDVLSPAQASSPGHCTVAATSDDGNCYLVDCSLAEQRGTETPGVRQTEATISVLPKPSDMKNGMIKHCRLLQRGLLCGTIVHRGRAAVLVWRSPGSSAWSISRRSRFFNPITGMDVSPDGRHVGIATTEGEAILLDASTLKVIKVNRKAHMVFATSVAFAGDSHAFVSTSADASARVTPLKAGTSIGRYLLFLLLSFLFFVMIAVAGLLIFQQDVMLAFEALKRKLDQV